MIYIKTDITKKIEIALFEYCLNLGQFVVEEVNLLKHHGIVDTLSLEFKGNEDKGYNKVWRCFEIKVSKGDFYSKAVHSFYGTYNYYVFPEDLFKKVEQDIPCGVGILLYRNTGRIELVRKPRKQQLSINEDFFLRGILGASQREIKKAKDVRKGLSIFTDKQIYEEVKSRNSMTRENGLSKYYEQFFRENKGKCIQLLVEHDPSSNQKKLIEMILLDGIDEKEQYIDELEQDLRAETRANRKYRAHIEQLQEELREKEVLLKKY